MPTGRSLKLATKTGHVTNYYEDKIPAYTVLDPLKLYNGTIVKDAATSGIIYVARKFLKNYETEIYGRVPSTAPKVTWKSPRRIRYRR